MMKAISLLAAASLVICVSIQSVAATWYVDDSVAVPGDGTSWGTAFQTIQEGIDAALDGDTVIVAEGTYAENVEFRGKNIVLRSTDPTDSTVVENTIVDGGKRGSVVTFVGTESGNCVLSGLTIQNGEADYGGGILGGTAGRRTRATIQNNRIAANTAEHGGGLAYCDGIIRKNVITGNSAARDYGRGGGLYACDGTIMSNTISENAGDWGGGLAWCDGTVRGNTISSNSAGKGGGLCECHGSVHNNMISENSVGDWGGGLARCNGAIVGNVISDNSGGMWGGGLIVCSGLIENNTIVGNSASSMGGGVKTCDAVVRNCIIWGNSAPTGPQIFESPVATYCCIQGWTGGGEGNISDNPSFVDYAGGDYHLEADSPCVDAGVNADWMWQGLDPDGSARILSGQSPAIVDIGAYEHPPPLGGVVRTWYVDDSVSESGDGSSWQTAKKTIQQGMDIADHGDIVLVAPGVYFENVNFGGKNIVLRSSGAAGARAVSSTIIDGNQSGSVVTFSGTEDERCVLSGFTIRNGSAENGGGIFGGAGKRQTLARIENNVIAGNTASANGGGLYGCKGLILNNSICDNAAGTAGSGLYECKGIVRGCIVWGNTGANQIDEGSSTPAYSCVEGWAGGGEGNMAQYPYFVGGGNGDYRLLSRSPCVNRGDPLSPFTEEPSPNGGRTNLGAFGNTPEAASRGADSDSDRLPDGWEVEHFGHLGWSGADDLDRDLVSNLQAYHRGTDPLSGSPRTPGQWYVDGSVTTSGHGTSWETAFKTVQEGIDAASDGDAVIVAQGTYLENIRLRGKNIAVRGTDPLDADVVANTIIDGGGSGSVVCFSGTEEEACLLEGLTIRNGDGQYGGGVCGGVYMGDSTQAIIRNNVITGNSAYRGGGLAYCDGLIERNVIVDNSAARGGGLAFCNGLIQNNTMSRNAVAGEASGGGALESCWGIIQNNVLIGNSVTGLATQGGALCGCHGVAIRNNLICGNRVIGERSFGGGITVCYAAIENNTVIGNSTGYGGGGMSWIAGSIRNCIVRGNTASTGPQFYDSRDPTYSCIQGGSAGEGNLSSDPEFVDANGPDDIASTYEDNDYRLSENSLCIDAGQNQEWMQDAVDLDGNPRVWQGKDFWTVDMGVYEYGSYPFEIVGIVEADGGRAELTWSSRTGDSYAIWSTTDLSNSKSWSRVGTVSSQGDTTSWTDSDTSSARKFYRIGVE